MTKLSHVVTLLLQAARNSGLPIVITGKQGTGKSTLAKTLEEHNMGSRTVEIDGSKELPQVLNRVGNATIVVNGHLDGEDVKDLSYVSVKCFNTSEGEKRVHFIPVERKSSASYDRLSGSLRALVITKSQGLDINFSYLKSRNIKTVEIKDKSDLPRILKIINIQSSFNEVIPEIQLPGIHLALDMDNEDVESFVEDGGFWDSFCPYRVNMYVTLHSKKEQMWSPQKLGTMTITPNMIVQYKA